jgi:hypothetical protein
MVKQNSPELKPKGAKIRGNSRKKAQNAQKGWDRETSALGYGMGLAAKERKDRKKE